MNQLYYQVAVDSVGQPFLDAEAYFISQGQAAVPFLQDQLKKAQNLARPVTQVLLDRIAGNQAYQDCLAYLDQAETRAAETPMRVPPPESVALYLFQHFGAQVASLLGVYLLKLSPVWPGWKTKGVILYLGKLDSAASADFLIPFLTGTADELYRSLARQSLVQVGDADTLARIDAAVQPLAAGQSLLAQVKEQILQKMQSHS